MGSIPGLSIERVLILNQLGRLKCLKVNMANKTCASCRFFGRDEEPVRYQGWKPVVYHCKAQDEYEATEAGEITLVRKTFVSSDRPKCKLYEAKEENAIS